MCISFFGHVLACEGRRFFFFFLFFDFLFGLFFCVKKDFDVIFQKRILMSFSDWGFWACGMTRND